MSDARAAAVLRLDAVGPRAEPPLEGRGHSGQRDPVSAEAAARRDRRALGHCDRHLRLDALFPAARRPHRHRLRGHSALLRAHLSPAAPTRGQRAEPTHLAFLREHSGFCFVLALFPLLYFVVFFCFKYFNLIIFLNLEFMDNSLPITTSNGRFHAGVEFNQFK